VPRLLSVETTGRAGVFERLFRAYGLPARIRSDNGVPFATAALGRLSALSAWWIKLGITPELIEPSSPQQNGQHERMHRTLKAEATKPARASLAPSSGASTPSARVQRGAPARGARQRHAGRPLRAVAAPVPGAAAEPRVPGHFEVRYVSRNGGVRWHNRWVNVSHVLAEEYVGSRRSTTACGPCTSGRCCSGASTSGT
jgi:transposase InsO family protein